MSESNELLANIKTRIDYKFYSNVLNVITSNQDAYIDFMQFPEENGEVATVRIFMTHAHLKQFCEVLQGLPLIKGEESKEQ